MLSCFPFTFYLESLSIPKPTLGNKCCKTWLLYKPMTHELVPLPLDKTIVHWDDNIVWI